MDYFEDWEDDEYDDGLGKIRRGKKWDKIAYDSTKHYPNKHEAECLRRIMSKSGLTEEEVRTNKTYRVELSKAREEGVKAKRDQTTKWAQYTIKRACQKTEFFLINVVKIRYMFRKLISYQHLKLPIRLMGMRMLRLISFGPQHMEDYRII